MVQEQTTKRIRTNNKRNKQQKEPTTDSELHSGTITNNQKDKDKQQKEQTTNSELTNDRRTNNQEDNNKQRKKQQKEQTTNSDENATHADHDVLSNGTSLHQNRIRVKSKLNSDAKTKAKKTKLTN